MFGCGIEVLLGFINESVDVAVATEVTNGWDPTMPADSRELTIVYDDS